MQDNMNTVISYYHIPKSPCNTIWIQSSHIITFQSLHASQHDYSHLIVSHSKVSMQDNMNTVISYYHIPKSSCNTTRIQSSHIITFQSLHARQHEYSHLILSHSEVPMQDNMNTVISYYHIPKSPCKTT
nr:hypothetical protein BgiMline_008568 [Biomphalaria glabrata]